LKWVVANKEKVLRMPVGQLFGTYTLQPKHDLSKFLTVFGATPKNGAPIVQFVRPFEEGRSQQFDLQEVDVGVFALSTRFPPEKFLTVFDGSLDDLAPIILSEWEDGDHQKFVPEGGSFETGPITNIRLRTLHSGKCLDVFGGSTNNGAPIIQFNCHEGLNQRWLFDLQ
jgi:ricin-type beta-trefoil lectin protein